MTGDGGFGADDGNVVGLAESGRGAGARFDDADTGNVSVRFDGVHGERGGGVAGDDEVFRALALQEVASAKGITGDRVGGLGAVGKAGGVAEVEILGVRNE